MGSAERLEGLDGRTRMMSSPPEGDRQALSPSPLGKGKWKRRRRSLLKRFLRKTTLIAIVAIAGALAVFYYVLHHISLHREQD